MSIESALRCQGGVSRDDGDSIGEPVANAPLDFERHSGRRLPHREQQNSRRAANQIGNLLCAAALALERLADEQRRIDSRHGSAINFLQIELAPAPQRNL